MYRGTGEGCVDRGQPAIEEHDECQNTPQCQFDTGTVTATQEIRGKEVSRLTSGTTH